MFLIAGWKAECWHMVEELFLLLISFWIEFFFINALPNIWKLLYLRTAYSVCLSYFI